MTHQLEESGEGLIASLHKSAADLDFIANKLEQEFASRCQPGEINPMLLLQRITRLQR
jgi:hypothetical protein